MSMGIFYVAKFSESDQTGSEENKAESGAKEKH
jgi:hypothetical protein